MATSTIIQSSNNSTSEYCKMPDGTLICFGQITFTAVSNTGIQTVSTDFPHAFINTPVITLTMHDSEQAYDFIEYPICSTNTTASKLYVSTKRLQTKYNWKCNYIAIGRWK